MTDLVVPVITIDGPSGVGKGTIAKFLAHKLSWHLLDSGKLYRVLSVAVSRAGVALADSSAISRLAESFDVRFVSPLGAPMSVFLDGDDVSELLGSEDVGSVASHIAQLSEVREALFQKQRVFCQPPGLVADGRDMGTVIFPEAVVKLFLSASVEERAKRRYKQLKEKGFNASLSQLKNMIEERDQRDRSRIIAPLKPAEDAVVIDTTTLSVSHVINELVPILAHHGFSVN